ncbi:MAG: class III poly(R)-hydroxyalkanoic acid synthase subunit PhaE [Gammaproteobacteria bacterium]|nr:MAG: class III poly(R)-hydroxyalkanoic acid synthase subunit PhaE [Gammaproteobacteria bacterium]
MTEKESRTVFDNDWFRLQQQYWDAWQGLSKRAMEALGTAPAEVPVNPWAEGLEQWWKAMAPIAPSEGQEVFEHLLDQGRNFFALGDQFTRLLQGLEEAQQAGSQWQEVLRQRFDEMKEMFSGMTGAVPPNPFTQMPLDTILRTLSTGMPLPGDLFHDIRSQAWGKAGEQLHEHVTRFLSVPGVGYTRETQEQLQTLASRALEYQRALQEFNQAHAHLAGETLDRLLQRLLEKAERDEAVTSLRELYDLWVDCAEEAYARFANSEEYSRLYGKVVNALMAFKQEERRLVDEFFSAIGAPSSRDFNNLARQQHELRRDLFRVQRELAAAPSAAAGLERELESLRQAVAALQEERKQAASEAEPTAAPAPRKKVARKKAATRKKAVARKKVARKQADTGEKRSAREK